MKLFTHFLSLSILDLVFRQSRRSTLQIHIDVQELVIDFMKQLLIYSISGAIFNFIIHIQFKIRISRQGLDVYAHMCFVAQQYIELPAVKTNPFWGHHDPKVPYLYFFNVYGDQDQSLMLVYILPAKTRLMTELERLWLFGALSTEPNRILVKTIWSSIRSLYFLPTKYRRPS